MNEFEKMKKDKDKAEMVDVIVNAVGYAYMFLSVLMIGLKFTVLQAVSWWIILLPTFIGLGFLFFCIMFAVFFIIGINADILEIQNKNNKKGEIEK